MRRILLLACAVLFGTMTVLAALAFVRVAPINVRALAHRDPGRSALMLQREREAKAGGRRYHESRHWVRLDGISRHLREAVLVAEDDAFFSHEGFDWAGIRDAARRNLRTRKVVRGGSTITQQLAKNLWLGTSRTPWRKFEEMILAIRLERALTKRRILELYLNSIEWGDGVYGIDAAARHWFGTSAGALDAGQSVRLASVIINPRRFSPVEPNRRIQRRIKLIAGRLRRRGAITGNEYRAVLGLPPEAPAPTVDSTLLGPREAPPASPGAAPPGDSLGMPGSEAPVAPGAPAGPAPDSSTAALTEALVPASHGQALSQPGPRPWRPTDCTPA